MKQFIYDMINMTEGQKFINYWWLWLMLWAISLTLVIIKNKLDKDIMKTYKDIARYDWEEKE